MVSLIQGKPTFELRDSPVREYGEKHNRIIHKIGNMGLIGVYSDDFIPTNEIYMYENNLSLETQLDRDKFRTDTRAYLCELIIQLTGKTPEIKEKPKTALTEEERIKMWRERIDD